MRALVKLEQVLPAHLRRRVERAGLGDRRAPGRRADRRPPASDGDRRRVPRHRAPALRLPKPRRRRQPPRGRAALARQPRPPLVPGRLGPRSRGLAHLPRRPAHASRADGGAVQAAPAAGRRRGRIRRAEHHRRAAPLRGPVTLHAAADQVAGRVPAHWGTIEAKDADSCVFRTGDDDLDWLAMRIAMLGVDFEVHEPPELAEHLRSLAGRLSRAAGRRGARRHSLRHALCGARRAVPWRSSLS